MKSALIIVFTIVFLGLCYLAYLRVEQSDVADLKTRVEKLQTENEKLKSEMLSANKALFAWQSVIEQKLYEELPEHTDTIAEVFKNNKQENETTDSENTHDSQVEEEQ